MKTIHLWHVVVGYDQMNGRTRHRGQGGDAIVCALDMSDTDRIEGLHDQAATGGHVIDHHHAQLVSHSGHGVTPDCRRTVAERP